ncbi:phage head morphogenesis protein [Bilophila wadsworthia]|jgi:uncharacterized protein with gpF-like domain|uniref:phage head morphogenesis protein n=1 Tax=Bilophila wadsworthia TaxID=35833 RepID=UPI002673FCCA|nr:phage minor head protein [Bilophila wadsworthia]
MAKVIRAIKPNAGIRAKYRKRLVSLLDEMQRSVVWWLRAEYRKQETRIAQDASPASDLQDRLKSLFRYWTKRWRESAESFAREFVGSTRRRTEAGMRQALKDAGFTVRMEGSRAMSDVARALFEENVNLIKSIPQHYFTEVTGLVQRSASMGRDVEFLADELHKRYEITRRRAEFIARDQSNKATEAIKRVQDKELGITEGVWVHVPGKKTSRHTHQLMNGKKFVITEGLYDSDVKRKVLCGELPGCQCTYRAVIPEFGD